MQQQFTLSMQAYDGIKQTFAMLEEIKTLQARLKEIREKTGNNDVQKEIADLEQKLNTFLNGNSSAPVLMSEFPLNRLNGAFQTLLDVLQDTDTKPTTQAVVAAKGLQDTLRNASILLARLREQSNKLSRP